MIKVGLAGVGHLGKIHLKLLKEIGSIELVGFYDSQAALSAEVSKEFGVKSFNSVDELMDQVEALIVVTPTLTHKEISINALKRSIHVFIEKPISESIEEAKQIISTAREAGVKLQIGHVERFNPAFISVKEFIQNPRFIETHRLAQFNPRGTDVSVVLDLMIHDIDIVLSLVNSNVKRIHASGVVVVSDTPDICSARIEFDNGAVANITTSRLSMKNMRKSRFFQRDAYISVDFLEKKTELIRIKNIDKEPDDPFAVTLDLGEKGMKQILLNQPDVPETNAIKSELESFFNAIENNQPVEVSGEDGLKALEVARQIMDKMQLSTETVV